MSCLLKAAEEQHDVGLALYVDGGDAPVGYTYIYIIIIIITDTVLLLILPYKFADQS